MRDFNYYLSFRTILEWYGLCEFDHRDHLPQRTTLVCSVRRRNGLLPTKHFHYLSFRTILEWYFMRNINHYLPFGTILEWYGLCEYYDYYLSFRPILEWYFMRNINYNNPSAHYFWMQHSQQLL